MKKLLLIFSCILLFSCEKQEDYCGRIASIKLISIDKYQIRYYEVILEYPNHYLSKVIGIYSSENLRIGNKFCE